MPAGQNKEYLWKVDRWNGGESEDSRIGPPGSFEYGVGWEIHDDTGKLQVANLPVEESDGDLIDKVIKWIEENPSNGDVYYYGEDEIFKESSGTYSSVRSVAAGTPNGQGLADFDGHMYYRTGTTLGRYDYASTWDDSWQTGLESVTDFAPLFRFKNLLLVANGRYVGTVDDVGTWNASRLTLPPGYKVRSFTAAGGLVFIAAIRGSTITGSELGYLFVWDGTSENYNDFIPVNGNPHAIVGLNNRIVIIAGNEPIIYHSSGASPQEMFRIPNIGVGKTAEVWPGAIDTWRGRIYYGISDGTSTSVLRLVREWGAKNAAFPLASNPIYPASTGTLTGTSMQITALKRIGNTIRFAWKDDTDHGVDEVDTTQYQAAATYRSLVFDRQSPFPKRVKRAVVELSRALLTNETVNLKISADAYGDPTFADNTKYNEITLSTLGSKLLVLPFTNAAVPVKERDLKFELISGGTAATKPPIKRVWVEFEEMGMILPDY